MLHEHHDHSHGSEIIESHIKTFAIGIVLNVVFALAEVIAGIYYNSIALLTDAGHNISDVAGLVISLIAFWLAKKKSSATFTYGYKKTTVLAAFINAVVLLIAIGILGYESIMRLIKPEPVQGTVVSWVAAIGIIANGITAYLFYKSRRLEINAKSAYLHILTDTLVSAGVVIAGIIITYTQWYWIDPLIGLLIMFIILAGTWNLFKDSVKMSIDAVPSGIQLQEIKDIMSKVAGVRQVSHIHVWPLSTTENAMTGHLVTNENLSFEEKLAVVKEIKHALLHHGIQHSTIELEKE